MKFIFNFECKNHSKVPHSLFIEAAHIAARQRNLLSHSEVLPVGTSYEINKPGDGKSAVITVITPDHTIPSIENKYSPEE